MERMSHSLQGVYIMSAPESFQQSLWSAVSPAGMPLTPLRSGSPLDEGGAITADVVVVGAGFLGLSLALQLAEGGATVLVLEADEIGFGASGRNTGFVVPRLKGSLGLDAVTRMLGGAQAETLLNFVGGVGDNLFTLLDRLKIECDAEQTGFLAPAHDAGAMKSVEKQVREARALGQPLEALDAAQTMARLGFGNYVGSLFVPSGGQINPLSYVRGLARAASNAGALLHQGRVASLTPIAQISAGSHGHGVANNHWRVRIEGGAEVVAERVVLTTNALVGALRPEVAHSLLPFSGFQIASQRLGADVQQAILPHRQPMADMRNSPFALRWSADGRLVGGGAAIFPTGDALPRMSDYFIKRFAEEVPSLPPLRVEFAWRGVIAGTGDFLPRLWQTAPGLYAPIGCNGRGVALTTALGQAFGRYLLDGNAAALPVPIKPPRPFPFHGLARFAPSLWLTQARWRDWRRSKANAEKAAKAAHGKRS
jgi:glycine/D-amino acid oxidase-like deaminating enzyme